jgi:hypothetical protein
MSKRLIQFVKVFEREWNKRFQLTPERKSKNAGQAQKKPKPEKS